MSFESAPAARSSTAIYPVGTGMRLKEIWRRRDPNGSSALCGNEESKSANGNQRYGQNQQFCAVGPWRTRHRQAARTRLSGTARASVPITLSNCRWSAASTRYPPYDRYSRSARWQGLRAELWLCSPVWCALRMGYRPKLVSGAAAAGCLAETILTSAADFVAVTRGHQFEYLVPRRAAVNAVLLWLVSGSGRRNGRERERKT